MTLDAPDRPENSGGVACSRPAFRARRPIFKMSKNAGAGFFLFTIFDLFESPHT